VKILTDTDPCTGAAGLQTRCRPFGLMPLHDQASGQQPDWGKWAITILAQRISSP
jgi:hypothetical protein